MKICKACDSEYNNELTSCPYCGSNKYYTDTEIAAEEERLVQEHKDWAKHEEQAKKRKRNTLIATLACLVIVAVVAGCFVVKAVKHQKEIKSIYEEGMSYYEAGDMESAILTLSEVPEHNKYYKRAQATIKKAETEYVAETIAAADARISENDYETAIDILNRARDIVSKNEQLEEKHKQVVSVYKSTVLSKAEILIQEKNYGDAIDLLDAASRRLDDSEIEARLSTCKDIYRDEIEKKARTALDKEGYDKAMGVLLSSKEVLGNDEKMNEIIEKFRSFAPINLCEMEPYEVNQYARIGNEGKELDEDNYGNRYTTNGVISNKTVGFSGDVGVVKYYLNKEYSVLEGTIYVPKQSKSITPSFDNFSSDDGPTNIWIYGDGKKLYTAKQIFNTDRPYHIMVDISGVEFLEIRVLGGWYKGDVSGLNPTMCIADLSVSKR